MKDLFNPSSNLTIETGTEKPVGAIEMRVVSKPDALLKKQGDISVEKEGAELRARIYAGDKLTNDSWRVLGGKIAVWLKKYCPEVTFLECGEADRGGLLEGLLLGAYDFTTYKAADPDSKPCRLIVNLPQDLFAEKKIICDAVNMARDWSHEPASVINPWTLSERAEKFAKEYGLKCRILDDQELTKMGAGAIVAVGQGSKTPSRMIILEYAGQKKEKPVVFVGKAITFDSGGYSIKPGDSMVTMKYDKCGAMDVLGILRAASLLKLKTPITGIICAAENMLSEKSYRPDDILTSLSGKTIEVISTDAEGRLVLSDGLSYAQKYCDPRCIIDFATLTGGCVVALGHVRAGIMCPDQNLFDGLFASGEKTWERLWRLPSDEDYAELMKSPDADIKNSGGRWGSPVTGGIFLKAFVADEMPWAHIDIAGVADSDKASAYCVPGATGFGIRLAIDWLQNQN